MRIRSIKPEFFKSERVASVDPLARLLFAGLWGLADSEGRLLDRPTRIKVDTLPYDDVDMNALLAELHSVGLIQRYQIDGVRLIQIVKFRKHQRISGVEAATPSEFPPPEKQSRSSREAVEKQSRSSREGPIALEGKGKEREGREEGGAEPHPSFAAAPLTSDSPPEEEASFQLVPDDALISNAEALNFNDPIVTDFPVRGDPQNRTWALRESLASKYRQAYPGLNLEGEITKARLWLEANPGRTKTARGMPEFLRRWFERTANQPAPPRTLARHIPRNRSEAIDDSLAEWADDLRARGRGRDPPEPGDKDKNK